MSRFAFAIDQRSSIGCKACMYACPYDALYIDPDSHTVASPGGAR